MNNKSKDHQVGETMLLRLVGFFLSDREVVRLSLWLSLDESVLLDEACHEVPLKARPPSAGSSRLQSHPGFGL